MSLKKRKRISLLAILVLVLAVVYAFSALTTSSPQAQPVKTNVVQGEFDGAWWTRPKEHIFSTHCGVIKKECSQSLYSEPVYTVTGIETQSFTYWVMEMNFVPTPEWIEHAHTFTGWIERNAEKHRYVKKDAYASREVVFYVSKDIYDSIEVGDFIEGSGEKRVSELLPRMNRLEKNRGSMLLCAEGLITYLYYPKAAELSAMVS